MTSRENLEKRLFLPGEGTLVAEADAGKQKNSLGMEHIHKTDHRRKGDGTDRSYTLHSGHGDIHEVSKPCLTFLSADKPLLEIECEKAGWRNDIY